MSEVFIGRKGRFVKLEETIDGFGGTNHFNKYNY
jgi:F0F1-type ATP synthase beta subunit